MTKEALKLALEALQLHLAHHEHGCVYLDPAVTAIKEALAQDEQWTPERIAGMARLKEAQDKKLAQPKQEPVAWGFRHHDGAIYDCISPEAHADCEGEYNVPLYDTPPQRPWVGLTAEEAAECWTTSATQTWKNFEAKLKEKNT